MVLESQLPDKLVSLLFTFNKMTILSGVDSLKPFNDALCEIRCGRGGRAVVVLRACVLMLPGTWARLAACLQARGVAVLQADSPCLVVHTRESETSSYSRHKHV